MRQPAVLSVRSPHAMQRKKPRNTVPVESLEQMQSELEAARLEGQAIKEEWQQMNRRMKDAQQRLAAVQQRQRLEAQG